MESNREKNEKLLILIAEIRQLVGDFDASSILEKAQFDQNSFHDPCVESDHDKICDRDHAEKAMTLKQLPAWKSKHSPETKRGVATPFSPAAVRSVTATRSSDFKLHEVDAADVFSRTPNATPRQNEDEKLYYDSSNEQRSSFAITPQSYQQRRHRLSSSRYSVPQSGNRAAAETVEKRNCQILKKASIPSDRLYGTSIPALDINTFMEDLPSNSPVRTLISNCIASVSPARRLSEYVEDRRASLGKDKISHKKTKNKADKSSNFLELVCVGANRESLNGSSFLIGSSEEEQLSSLNQLQRGKLEILDHFKLGNDDDNFSCIIESITDYCFPDGIVIDVILKADVLKYAGARNDAMHVLQFSDVTGTPTYACCLTVTEHIQPKNKDIIRSLLLQKRSYSRAVGIITKAFRRLIRKRKEHLTQLSKNISGSEHSIFDRKLSFYSMSTPFKFGSSKVNADIDDSEVKPPGVGFGSAIMSRLKMGISFAGGRTTEKPLVGKTPGRKTNKVLWSDLDEDKEENEEDDPLESEGSQRVKESVKSKFGSARRINDEDDYDGDEEEIDPDNRSDRGISDDGSRGSRRGFFSPAASATPDTMNSPRAPSASPYTTEGTPRGSAPAHHSFDTTSIMSMISSGMEVFSPARRSPMQDPAAVLLSAHRGSAVTDRGHLVTELEGLHMHGFSSESEGDDEGDAEMEELDSSFESDNIVKNDKTSKDKNIRRKSHIIDSQRVCLTPSASPPVLQGEGDGDGDRRCSTESDDHQNLIQKSLNFDYHGSKSSPGSIADSSISEKETMTVEKSTEKEGVECGSELEVELSVSVDEVPSRAVVVVPENVDEYVLVTKRAYCILSLEPVHSLSFAVLAAVAKDGRGSLPSEPTTPCAQTEVSTHICTPQEETEHAKAGFSNTKGDVQAVVVDSNDVIRQLGNELEAEAGTETGAGAGVNEGVEALSMPRVSLFDNAAFLSHMMTCSLNVNLGSKGFLDNVPPSFADKFPHSFQMAPMEEWSSAVLFCTLPCATIMKTLSLLLLENSLVVCGPPEASGLITAITTAFLLLLKPFQWAGIFVPILPKNALEVMEAPVPFIAYTISNLCTTVGTIHTPRSSSISSSAAVIHLGDFLSPSGGKFLGARTYLNTQDLTRKEQEEEKEKEGECDTSGIHEEMKEDEKDSPFVAAEVILAFSSSASASASVSANSSSSALLQINTSQTPSRRGRVQEKKYLQLPVGTSLYGSESQVDFSLDLSYQKLISRMEDGKKKLCKLLCTRVSANSKNRNDHNDDNLDDDDDDIIINSPLWSLDKAKLAMKMFLFHITEEERGVVRSLLAALETHNLNLCSNLSSDPSAWQRYGIVNTSSGEFDFYPEMFIDPLRARIDFQVELAHTQMFVAFVDKKRTDYNTEMERKRLLLCDWLRFRVLQRKHKISAK